MNRHALIVDDDPIIRNLMAALLRRKRISSSQAVNGEEAITLFRDALSKGEDIPYDLIVLDLMMPKASGSDVVSYVEEVRPAMLRHVIVVSASGENSLDSLRERGCGCVLQKPFDPDEFYKAVEHCLRPPRTPSRNNDGGFTLSSFFL